MCVSVCVCIYMHSFFFSQKHGDGSWGLIIPLGSRGAEGGNCRRQGYTWLSSVGRFEGFPRRSEEGTWQFVAFLFLPLTFMIQKPVIIESIGIGSLLTMGEMGEGELILKIIAMPEIGQLWSLLGPPNLSRGA